MNKRPILLTVIVVNLAVLVALVFAYPHLMVSPGPLVTAHGELATDCFACHAPWHGASSARCIKCHAVADIGLKTTRGEPIVTGTVKASFHQALIEQNCVACHSDHQGSKLAARNRKPFSHMLLQPTVRDRCSSCHAAPADAVHRDVKIACGQCHQSTAWKPAHFDHALLAKAVLDQCEGCHTVPADRLHREIRGSCKSCHRTEAWKPATFDHDKYFVLDRDHQTSCETCHRQNGYSQYTCYGCHEHTPAKVRAKHIKEGIQNFENCVECHRDPREEPEKHGTRERNRHD